MMIDSEFHPGLTCAAPMTDDRKRNTGGDNPEWVAEVVAAAVGTMQVNGLANRTEQLAKVPGFIREQSRALAESRAEVERLREAVLAWWEEHKYDTDSHPEDGERNLYSEPPQFVRIAMPEHDAGGVE